jgi:hypothetical protein
MSAATYQTFLDAPSMGQYYNANIQGAGADSPFDCRKHRGPKYREARRQWRTTFFASTKIGRVVEPLKFGPRTLPLVGPG